MHGAAELADGRAEVQGNEVPDPAARGWRPRRRRRRGRRGRRWWQERLHAADPIRDFGRFSGRTGTVLACRSAGSMLCWPSGGSRARGRARRRRSARDGCASGGTGRSRRSRASWSPTDADLVVIEPPRFVSRGGIKLENALDALGIDVAGLDCLDVGASTGGFTDCLLQRGAARVIALDVAYGQLDWRPAQRSAGDRDRAPQRPRARPRRPAVRAAPGDGRRLLHLAGQGAARRGPLPRRRTASCWRWSSRSSSSAASGSARGRRARRRGPPRGDPRRRRERPSAVGLAVRGFASSGLPGPKGNRETFVWCGAAGESVGDLEAAIAAVEP